MILLGKFELAEIQFFLSKVCSFHTMFDIFSESKRTKNVLVLVFQSISC